jgi:hypothetical protein
LAEGGAGCGAGQGVVAIDGDAAGVFVLLAQETALGSARPIIIHVIRVFLDFIRKKIDGLHAAVV